MLQDNPPSRVETVLLDGRLMTGLNNTRPSLKEGGIPSNSRFLMSSAFSASVYFLLDVDGSMSRTISVPKSVWCRERVNEYDHVLRAITEKGSEVSDTLAKPEKLGQ
jgi:hypothetical protein